MIAAAIKKFRLAILKHLSDLLPSLSLESSSSSSTSIDNDADFRGFGMFRNGDCDIASEDMMDT